ncbi:MAG: response regulator [Bacteroidota bacterium]
MNNLTEPFFYKRIMIIDDNEIDRYICKRISKTYHLAETVIEMETAMEALEYLISIKEYPECLPELVFLDINMPGMNGFEFLEAYKDLPESIKKNCIVVMLTSSTHNNDSKRVKEFSHVKGYLEKPLDEAKIRRLCSEEPVLNFS